MCMTTNDIQTIVNVTVAIRDMIDELLCDSVDMLTPEYIDDVAFLCNVDANVVRDVIKYMSECE